MTTSLSPEEIARYRRHLVLKGFGLEAQQGLKSARVLMIGAGGLGCPTLLYLAAAGVGHITIIDPDAVDASNLQRQVLYGTGDLGRPKAECAAQRLAALNPFSQVTPIVDRFRKANALELCRAADVVVDGTDNFAARYLSNDACVLADRPLVYGAIHHFEGQASVFNWRGGPTYRCLFPEPPDADSVPNCAQAGVLGVLPGLIGTIQATETIKLLTGIGTPLSGRLMLWDALTMETRTLRLKAIPASRRIVELPEDAESTCRTVAASPSGDEIAAEQVAALLRTRAAFHLLDVRDEEERSFDGGIADSTHLPLGRLRAGERPKGLESGDDIVVFCAAGVRSLRALPLLKAQGFTRVRSMAGGMGAWERLAR